MIFFRNIGVGHPDLTPQNSSSVCAIPRASIRLAIARVKSDILLDLTQKSLFLDGHSLMKNNIDASVLISVCGSNRLMNPASIK